MLKFFAEKMWVAFAVQYYGSEPLRGKTYQWKDVLLFNQNLKSESSLSPNNLYGKTNSEKVFYSSYHSFNLICYMT